MKHILLAAAALSLGLGAGQSLAQGRRAPPPGAEGAVVETEGNVTGGGQDRIISRGATGADTTESDSAAGGNAGQPALRVPQGGSGGGGDGG